MPQQHFLASDKCQESLPVENRIENRTRPSIKYLFMLELCEDNHVFFMQFEVVHGGEKLRLTFRNRNFARLDQV
jgi:hypothetical protein